MVVKNEVMVNELQRHLDSLFRPLSCGAKADINAYLQWKVHQQQLWRLDELIIKPSVVIPFVPIDLKEMRARVPEHKTPPRKRDLVIDDADNNVGMIIWVDREADEAGIRWFKPRDDVESVYLTSLDSNRGKVRWRIMR